VVAVTPSATGIDIAVLRDSPPAIPEAPSHHLGTGLAVAPFTFCRSSTRTETIVELREGLWSHRREGRLARWVEVRRRERRRDPVALAELADALIASREYDLAEQLLGYSLDRHPGQPLLRLCRADLAAGRRRWDEVKSSLSSEIPGLGWDAARLAAIRERAEAWLEGFERRELGPPPFPSRAERIGPGSAGEPAAPRRTAPTARSLYYAHRYTNDGQEVDFLSLAELVETIQVPAGREARWPDFAAWFERHRGAFKLREPHRVFEEVTGVLTGSAEKGPHLGEDEYLSLGVRQSIFLGEERRAVYRVFERWLAHLREQGLFDANVAAWERRGLATERYDFLVIDEVQDVTPVELRLALATLRDKSAFLLCGDSNQIVHPNLFSWARVKSLFYGDGEHRDGLSPLDRIHVLSANYRNTRAVTALANRLLLVKQRRFGSVDRESNYLVESVSGEEGRVEVVADGARVRAELEARTRRSARTAVVVLRDEDKPAARAALSTPLLFSVQEAKGLEYENVILFNVVSSAPREFRECAAGVEPADLEGGLEYARARDKADKSLDAYKFYVNALYVAMTRAVKSLVVVEDDPGHPLLALLAVGEAADAVALAAEESSREEWQREARRLEQQGKAEQAERIRRDILEVRPVPWAVADAAALPGLQARALGPAPADRAAQQLLFEFAVTYDVLGLLPQLVAAGFRHARKAESGRAYIRDTHYSEYLQRRSPRLQEQLRTHGLDFRNPLNETPLMVAARVGRHDLVTELLALGADAEATDTAGRTALRVSLAAWLEQRGAKAAAFQQVWEQLATAPLKVKLGDRMVKLDPTTGEWFLLQLCLVQVRRAMDGTARQGALPVFDAPGLARLVADLPPGTLAAYRRRREYLSSLLAKNEVDSTNPYGRRLFQRLRRGAYSLCPALDIEVKGEWVPVGDLMGLPALFEAIGPEAAPIARWMAKARAALAPPTAPEKDAPSVGAGDGPVT
jgi:hypothetical protein